MPMPRLKIAFVVDRFGNRYGGAEAYGVELMRELAAAHDITVFARDYDHDCELKLPFIALRSWSFLPSWIRVLLFAVRARRATRRSEEHTSELQSLMRISYAVFCLKKKRYQSTHAL